MKLDSPLFDRIRVSPRARPDQRPRAEEPSFRTQRRTCDWSGCQRAAMYRAPKGRLREGQYWGFCLEHVREYNQSYNYFAGMSDDAVARYQKEAVTGHRPTWKMGLNGKRPAGARANPGHFYSAFDSAGDPFGIFDESGGGTRPRSGATGPARMVRNAERKALYSLGLEVNAKGPDIKARFKTLVKRHHPDANGGDRANEDKLREIIQAYNYLKSTGFC
jgi:curved DNA-binding protein CbpA